MNEVKVTIYEYKNGAYQEIVCSTVVLPVKIGRFLDEQLDYAVLTLKNVTRKNFPLLSVVKIEVRNEGLGSIFPYTTSSWLLVNDNSTESPVNSGRYTHDITIIEATKLAEGIPLESLCFTNVVGKYVVDSLPIEEPEIEPSSDWQGGS